MSWLSDLFHPGRPYEAAQDKYNQQYQQGQQYLDPYNKQGQQAGGQLQDIFSQLQNPEQLQNQWASGYQESPYAKQQQQFAQNAGLDAASSQGLLGSSSALQNIQNTSAGIVNQDQQQYMQDLMQKYLAGAGIGENLYGQGASAAGQQSGNALNAAGQNSQLEFGKRQAGSNFLGDIFGGAAGLGLNYLTGGLGKGGFGRGSLQPTDNWLRPQGGQH